MPAGYFCLSTCATCQSTPQSLVLQHTLGEPAPAAACDLSITLSHIATLHDLHGLFAELTSASRQAHSAPACARRVAFRNPSNVPCLSYLTVPAVLCPALICYYPCQHMVGGQRTHLLNTAYALRQTGFYLL